MGHEIIFRDNIIESLRRELVGPLWTDESTEDTNEILQESPILRYSAGVLFPNNQVIIEGNDADNLDTNNLEEIEDNNEKDGEEIPISISEKSDLLPQERQTEPLSTAYDETVRLANEFYPSAIGLSFIADIPENGLIIQARAAIYKSKKNDTNPKYRDWERKILEIQPQILKVLDNTKPYFDVSFDSLSENLKLRAIGHRRQNKTYLITVSLLNTKQGTMGKSPSGEDCFFQAEFDVTANGQYVFHEYHTTNKTLKDAEDLALELLYRKRKAFAVGHGCAAEWGDKLHDCTNKILTSIVPSFKVAPVEPRATGGNELSMYFLSGGEGSIKPEEIPVELENLSRDYETWVIEKEREIDALPVKFQETARANLKYCWQCLKRIQSGINLLKSNKKLLKAFMLANQAILMQQYHSRCEKRQLKSDWKDFPLSYRPKDNKSGNWRTFQIAFVLMNLQSLVTDEATNKDHSDRKVVDLIWFPTGGGKTEAYLGLAACNIFYRRLVNSNNIGCSVLMRYTLRLLTAQQFQRASSLICACELLRRKNPKELGTEPISIGLWVGESLTPTWREDACSAANKLINRQKQAANPFQLLKCPWCGTELDNPQKLGYVVSTKPKTVIFVCPEPKCLFSKRDERLPVFVIDEDIYETPPTLIIGTVDKFAMLAWRQDSGRIFGLGTNKNVDPPDLIIQDELHLISGPLGSVVGLYESAIDLLCSWKGRPPKIVASTATIRRASQQCLSLYDRETSQFPPQGIDISDSFFAVENQQSAGRVYAGVFATAASSSVNAMIKVVSSLLQSCASIPLPNGATEEARDPYWTLVQYFNSLRELGQALTLVEFSIPEYILTIAKRNKKLNSRRYLSSEELTSRRTADEIPKILERLEVRYPKSDTSDLKPLDTLLATNMISVGVDVSRLGLMVVAGQPKTTSEYIQATSRVGRSEKAPGLVITLYNPSRPRDRSHYEHFKAYHSAFYKFVEPTSVTPFSLPVLDRTLHAILIIVVRHLAALESPDKINRSSNEIIKAIEFISSRCRNSSPEHANIVLSKLNDLLQQWENMEPSIWGGFGKSSEKRPLMYPAGTEPLKDWDTSWATPTSMRNVDVECIARVVSEYLDPNER